MLVQFPRRLVGYNPASVALAFTQLEAEHATELARLRREVAAARDNTKGLNRQLSSREAEMKETEARVQTEMIAVLGTHGQSQEDLQATALRLAEQRRGLLEQVEQREALLREALQMHATFAAELRQLIQRFRLEIPDEGVARLASTGGQAGSGLDPESKRSTGDSV